jgi:serine/threonine-protein kinase
MDATMLTIPAGDFWMGDERQRVHVDAFQISKYAVTNAQYKRFVEATGHPAPAHWQGRGIPAGKALHPVVFVSWFDAQAYARWAERRLPSEAEWEKAARGIDGREYPWGDWAEGRCNTREAKIGDTTPVGQYCPRGDSPYGCVGMAGNVWEWTTPRSLSVNPVVRGGSWNYLRGVARCTYRIRHNPSAVNAELGFRLACSDAPP